MDEYPLLEDFLYKAIFIPKDYNEILPKQVIYNDDLFVFIKDFGKLKDDYCLVATINNRIIGATWVRIVLEYGHIDDDTPSFAISIHEKHRNKGIGTKLMKEMLLLLKEKGYKKASLSVQKENYAVKMYSKLGFKIVRQTREEYIMVCNLK